MIERIEDYVKYEYPQDGACVDADPDIFFPEHGTGPNANKLAKAICRGCVVREECLQDALNHGEQYGVWGGLSTPERSRLSKTVKSGRSVNLSNIIEKATRSAHLTVDRDQY